MSRKSLESRRPCPAPAAGIASPRFARLEAAVPQQRKLVIVMADGTTFESEVVTISDSDDTKLKKPIDKTKTHGGEIASVDLKKP
jgi:hypothetical protein